MKPPHPPSVLGQRIAPKHVYILIPETSEYAALHAKGELRSQIELSLLISYFKIEKLSWIICMGLM